MRHLALGLVVAGVLGIMSISHATAANNVPQNNMHIMGVEVPFYWQGGYNWNGQWVMCLYSDTTHRAVFCY